MATSRDYILAYEHPTLGYACFLIPCWNDGARPPGMTDEQVLERAKADVPVEGVTVHAVLLSEVATMNKNNRKSWHIDEAGVLKRRTSRLG
jgi:hypothetical protein